jgi:hypothetical protein
MRPSRLALAATLLVSVALVACGGGKPTTPLEMKSPAPVGAAEKAGFASGFKLVYESDAEFARDMDAMRDSGAKWIRFDMAWSSIEGTQGRYDWSKVDRMVDGALARGMHPLGILTYTPTWARPAGTDDKYGPTTDAARTAFGALAKAAAARYANRMNTWEIWNEPNIVNFWTPKPDASAYAKLLHAASVAIRSVDANATIISGGLAPAPDSSDGTRVKPLTFLTAAYNAGIGPDITGVGIHPYSFPASPIDQSTKSWNLFTQLPGIHDFMASRGDGGKLIWGTEFGAPTQGPANERVTEQQQAQYAVDAYNQVMAWTWMGPLFWYQGRDNGTSTTDREDNFGLWRLDFSPKPAYDAFRVEMQQPGSTPTTTPTTTPATTPGTTPNVGIDVPLTIVR